MKHRPDPATMPTELVPVRCQLCKMPVAVEIPTEGEFFHEPILRVARLTAVHDACGDRHDNEIKAAEIMTRETAKLCSWKTLCPPEYQKPIEWRYKSANRTNLNKVLAWQYGERGLLIYGEPGTCKTRFIWKLLEREWNNGRTMAMQSHTGFRQTVSALASADQQRMVNWIGGLIKVEILFLDDLGKGKSTPASEEAFFELIDSRMTMKRPVLFTSDMTTERIEGHFGEDYARGLMRRILERTEAIQF